VTGSYAAMFYALAATVAALAGAAALVTMPTAGRQSTVGSH
jgi:hypothetical protein